MVGSLLLSFALERYARKCSIFVDINVLILVLELVYCASTINMKQLYNPHLSTKVGGDIHQSLTRSLL
ncbi:hypothetical protein K440DRAFT_594406, partial [Wilcoxina mikolae CBS 423.85]